MSSSPPNREEETSGSYFATALPEWKRKLWREMSVAAQSKCVFDKDYYDENGDLNMHIATLKHLYRWVVCCPDSSSPKVSVILT